MRTVFCSTSAGVCVPCNQKLCAERRLVEHLKHQAAVAGVQRHSVARWVRRRAGTLRIERFDASGKSACSLPCILCRRVLDALGLRWIALTRDGQMVTESDAPQSELTRKQKMIFCK